MPKKEQEYTEKEFLEYKIAICDIKLRDLILKERLDNVKIKSTLAGLLRILRRKMGEPRIYNEKKEISAYRKELALENTERPKKAMVSKLAAKEEGAKGYAG